MVRESSRNNVLSISTSFVTSACSYRSKAAVTSATTSGISTSIPALQSGRGRQRFGEMTGDLAVGAEPAQRRHGERAGLDPARAAAVEAADIRIGIDRAPRLARQSQPL